jgi:ABC-type thiamine transport system substrate-binding protein
VVSRKYVTNTKANNSGADRDTIFPQSVFITSLGIISKAMAQKPTVITPTIFTADGNSPFQRSHHQTKNSTADTIVGIAQYLASCFMPQLYHMNLFEGRTI